MKYRKFSDIIGEIGPKRRALIEAIKHEHSMHYDYYECLDPECVCNTEGLGVYEEAWCECGLLREQHA